MITRAQGIDISRWDLSFDPQKAIKQIDFVIIKASEGTYWYDTAYPKMLTGVRQIPIRGAYHYFRNPGSDYLDQANWFLKRVEERANDFQFYALDFESINNKLSVSMSMWADKWMSEVQRRTEKKVVFYTNRNLYDLYGWHYCSRWPLWYAWYRNWPWSSPDKDPIMPKKRNANDWTIWQFSCEQNQPFENLSKSYGCGANKIDLNLFNGTTADMHAWLSLEEVLPTPP
ncbi:MAG: glycoside hydrolase family 25 protein, partial [Ignavibacteria bacterium]|nr:glycoside hydrolase family 25 protein [Ignavibacteria bacterium]